MVQLPDNLKELGVEVRVPLALVLQRGRRAKIREGSPGGPPAEKGLYLECRLWDRGQGGGMGKGVYGRDMWAG